VCGWLCVWAGCGVGGCGCGRVVREFKRMH